jgi:hypothetical protein
MFHKLQRILTVEQNNKQWNIEILRELKFALVQIVIEIATLDLI